MAVHPVLDGGFASRTRIAEHHPTDRCGVITPIYWCLTLQTVSHQLPIVSASSLAICTVDVGNAISALLAATTSATLSKTSCLIL